MSKRRRSRKNNWLFRKKNPQTYSSFHASLLFELSPLLTIYFVLLAKIIPKSTERTCVVNLVPAELGFLQMPQKLGQKHPEC